MIFIWGYFAYKTLSIVHDYEKVFYILKFYIFDYCIVIEHLKIIIFLLLKWNLIYLNLSHIMMD